MDFAFRNRIWEFLCHAGSNLASVASETLISEIIIKIVPAVVCINGLTVTIHTVVIPLRQFGSRHLFGVKVTLSSCSISSFNHR